MMPLAVVVNIVVLACCCVGFSGADLVGFCRVGGVAALRRDKNAEKVTKRDFEEALLHVRPSISPALLREYEKI
jgi:transitional endoplasmic reticulum ATPase